MIQSSDVKRVHLCQSAAPRQLDGRADDLGPSPVDELERTDVYDIKDQCLPNAMENATTRLTLTDATASTVPEGPAGTGPLESTIQE